MSCKKDPVNRRLALYFLRRLHRMLLVQDKQKERLNLQGERFLNKSIYSTWCDLAELGHKEAASWYIRRKPLKLFSAKTRTVQYPVEALQPQESGEKGSGAPTVIQKLKLKKAVQVYQDAQKGYAHTKKGELISLGGADLRRYRQAALEDLQSILIEMARSGFQAEAEKILRSRGLDWDILQKR